MRNIINKENMPHPFPRSIDVMTGFFTNTTMGCMLMFINLKGREMDTVILIITDILFTF